MILSNSFETLFSLRIIPLEQPGLQVPGMRIHGQLSAQEQEDSITVNELRALHNTVAALARQGKLQGGEVRFMQDNQAVMYIVRKWSSRDPLLMRLLRQFWLLGIHLKSPSNKIPE
eukprot:COSAG05_NODE_4914_length_1329_cov_1.303252_1_plen_116_part_00